MMNEENKKRNIIATIISLLFLGLIFAGVSISYAEKKNKSDVNVEIVQLYSSDYDLECFDNKYFIGSYEDNRIDVIIDETGSEILRNLDNIYYDGVYKMKDDRYLIYNNRNNNLTTYIFDGNNIELFYEIKDVSYAKPIVFKGIDREYILGFASMKDNNLYLYGLDSSGIVVVNDTKIIADEYSNGIYYTYNEKNIVVENIDNLYGVISLDGNVLIDYKYKDIINSYNDTFIAKNKKDKYGIIDKNNQELVEFKYKVIDQYDNYYLFVNKKNKMALYDNNYKKIIGFKMVYNSLLDYDLRSNIKSTNLYKVNGKIAIVNNYLEDINGTEYDKHKTYIIDGNTITKEIDEIGFGYDNIVYTYDTKYNVSIYNSDVSLLSEITLNNVLKINSIESVSSEVIRIKYIDKDNNKQTNYYDLKGNKIDFKLGDLYFKDIEYKGYITKNKGLKTLTIYDLEDNKIVAVSGKNIEKYNNYLIIDNAIYRIQ